MIDIHCHILPGLDDGPENLDDALKMARLAVKDGVQTVIATPHCFDGSYDCQNEDIIGRCEDFNTALERENIALTVLPGAEVRFTPELLMAVERGKALTLGNAGVFLLLELPEFFIPEAVSDIIGSLRNAEIRVILAHPERNSMILGKNGSIDRLIHAGAELQLTGDSLLGACGKAPQVMARNLLQKDVFCYLASDAHDTRRRKPILTKAVKAAGKIIGKEMAASLVDIERDLVSENSQALAVN